MGGAQPVIRVRRWIVNVLLVVAVIVAALMLLPGLLGYERYVIESDSMEGTIDRGSVVYSKPVDDESLREGDIITFKPPPDYGVDHPVTHRIVEVRPADAGRPRPVFRTKGDANATVDPWRFTLDDGEAAREEAHLPYLGYFYLALAIPWVRILLITVPALLIIVVTLASLWREAGREADEERRRLRERSPQTGTEAPREVPT
jgi:signal peptidase